MRASSSEEGELNGTKRYVEKWIVSKVNSAQAEHDEQDMAKAELINKISISHISTAFCDQ